jgi:hypothetical protein
MMHARKRTWTGIIAPIGAAMASITAVLIGIIVDVWRHPGDWLDMLLCPIVLGILSAAAYLVFVACKVSSKSKNSWR